ncbi:hypothetical protein YC2023_040310 [Brassica napus]
MSSERDRGIMSLYSATSNRRFPATVVNRLFPRSPRHSTYSWDLTLARVANASRTCGERIGYGPQLPLGQPRWFACSSLYIYIYIYVYIYLLSNI